LIGSRREQFGAALRAIFHTPYAIYYLPTDREVIIVRVLHGARDAAAIAEQGGFKT
jgi:toxin ParE1/3/4